MVALQVITGELWLVASRLSYLHSEWWEGGKENAAKL